MKSPTDIGRNLARQWQRSSVPEFAQTYFCPVLLHMRNPGLWLAKSYRHVSMH